jgi:SAP domain-containing ribonucleoprotein
MDYSKLKVSELKELLASRSLPVSGKKEDLVVRLVASDASTQSAADDLGDLAPPEEEYDWDAPATKM